MSSGEFGFGLFGEDLWGGDVHVLSPSLSNWNNLSSVGRVYRLQVLSPDGTLLTELPNYTGARIQESINAPEHFEFSYPLTESEFEYVAFPNLVSVLNPNGDELYRFVIKQIQKRMSVKEYPVAVVSCAGFMSRLALEVFEAFNTNGPRRVKDIVEALLEGQRNLLYEPIRLTSYENDCPASGVLGATMNYRWTQTTILRALRDIQKLVGGYFKVDFNSHFTWHFPSTIDPLSEFRLEKNLETVSVSRNYSNIRTYVKVKGTKPNGTEIYSIKKASDARIAEFGVAYEYANAGRVQSQEEVERYALYLLRIVSNPSVAYNLGVIDLSLVGSSAIDLSPEALWIGKRVRVIAEPVDTVTAQVISINRDFANPMAVAIEVGRSGISPGYIKPYYPDNEGVEPEDPTYEPEGYNSWRRADTNPEEPEAEFGYEGSHDTTPDIWTESMLEYDPGCPNLSVDPGDVFEDDDEFYYARFPQYTPPGGMEADNMPFQDEPGGGTELTPEDVISMLPFSEEVTKLGMTGEAEAGEAETVSRGDHKHDSDFEKVGDKLRWNGFSLSHLESG